MLNIAIIRTGGIGDVVLSFACIELLNKNNVQANLFFISKQPSHSLISEAFPEITPIEITRTSYSKNFKKLTQNISNLEMIADLQRSPRTIILSLLLKFKYGAKYYTWNKGSIRRTLLVKKAFFRNRNSSIKKYINENKYSRYAQMLECFEKALVKSGINISIKNAVPKILIHRNATKLGLTENKNYIAINLGASHPGKQAPSMIFEQILTELLQFLKIKFDVLLIGDKKCYCDSDKFKKKYSSFIPVHNFAGKLSLYETASILSISKITITSDGALSHISEAVGTPTATIFGSTIEAFGYQPFLNESKSFSTDIGCRPCTKDGVTTCRYKDKKCFTDLDLKNIIPFVASKLEKA